MLINVLTYNISWATQVNKVLGSEADFVEECQKEYKKGGIQCIKNAISNINKLKKLDLIGLQEVNSNIEKKIMKGQPNLKKFTRGKVGLSTVSTLWNPEIFGELLFEETINLIKGDDRPCLILVFKKNDQIFIIINLHMPWADKRIHAIKSIDNIINKNKTIRQHIFNDNTKIIMMGDFNDPKTSINKNKPLILQSNKKTIKLRHNKSKAQSRNTLKTCCWHKPKHKYKYFSDTGDYILVNNNIKQKSIKIPEIFKKVGRSNRLFSDHMPVLSTLEI
jgi:exonuclease III